MQTCIKIFYALLLLVSGLFINSVHATCTANTATVPVPTEIFNIPSYGVPTGRPIGDWIEINSPFATNCSSPIYSIYSSTYNASAGFTYTDGGMTYTVLKSGVAGIGFIAGVKAGTSSNYIALPASDFWLLSNTGVSQGTSINVTVKIKFISTASISPGQYSVPLLYLMGAYIYTSNGSNIGQGFAQTSAFTLKVTANTCNVTTSNLNVPLDNVATEDLPSVGSTAKDKVFNVGLNCQAGVYIYAQLNGTQDTNTTADGVLRIDNPAAANASKGVGIQILNGTTAMPMGTNMPAKFSNGGTESLPFTARYFRTTTNMAAGAANATATLNINYQ